MPRGMAPALHRRRPSRPRWSSASSAKPSSSCAAPAPAGQRWPKSCGPRSIRSSVPRRLLIAEDATATSSYAPPEGWSLLDFAVHPSREISVVIATGSQVRLLRLVRRGTVISQLDFQDAAIPNDTFFGDPLYIPILAYRYAFGGGVYARTWRTLVLRRPGRAVTGAARRRRQRADRGRRQPEPAEYAEAHAEHFKEALPGDFYSGALVTELAPDGRRVGTSFIEPKARFELKAVRWHGERIVAVGCMLPLLLLDGHGWDGVVSLIAAGQKGRAVIRTVDVDRDYVLLDVASLPDSRLLAAGSTGYFQNPNGASISEDAKPLLAVLDADGRVRECLNVTAGPRHNQVRALAPGNKGWLAAGMENGPGTHSADADAALLRADGWVRSVTLP